MSGAPSTPGSGLHVLHVITGTGIGGAERMLVRLCAQLGRRNCRNTVVSLQRAGPVASELRDAGATVMDLGLSPGRISFPALVRLRKLVGDGKPHVLQGWMYHGNLAATLARSARGTRPALAWNIRQSLYDMRGEPPLTRWVIRAGAALSRRSDAIVYNSAVSRRQHEAIGYCSRAAVIIDNGFEVDRFSPSKGCPAAYRARWHLSPSSIVFGCVARSHAVKNLTGLIGAFARAHAEEPAARLVLVGEGVDEGNTELTSCIQRHGVASAVVLAGPTTNVEGVLSAFDFFCLASNAEGFPNVVGEAMACERPCIVTDVGDSARIVGDTGWIVPRNDLNQLAQAIMAACRVPHCEHRARGIAARQRIVERFSVEVAGAAYWDLYQGLLSPPERAPAPN